MSVEGYALSGEEAKVVRVRLWERLGACGGLLVGLMKDEDAGLRARIHLLPISVVPIVLWADIFSPNFILTSKTPFILAVVYFLL